VPVVLKEAKVVFNLEHLVFESGGPIGPHFLRITSARFHTDWTDAQIVAIFHSAVRYMA
jgi:hypothetical protein